MAQDALLQPESRSCFEVLMAQGWVDAVRHLYPEQRIYTFWDYFRNHWARNAGLRIDHLLLNPGLSPYLKGRAWMPGCATKPRPVIMRRSGSSWAGADSNASCQGAILASNLMAHDPCSGGERQQLAPPVCLYS